MDFLLKKRFRQKPRDRSLRDRPRNRSNGAEPAPWYRTTHLFQGLLFILFVAVVSAICFIGKGENTVRFTVGQPASERVVAEFEFTYNSQVQANRRIAEARLQEPPVFRRSMEPFQRFETFLNDLNNRFAEEEIEFEVEGNVEVRARQLEAAIGKLIEDSAFQIDPEYVLLLDRNTSPRNRSDLLERTLTRLREIHEIGIYTDGPSGESSSDLRVIQIQTSNGPEREPEALSKEAALIRLRVAITSIAPDTATARALFGIFRGGIVPNLLYSESATEAAIARAIGRIQTPSIRVRAGETILEAGSIVTESSFERVQAYREVAAEQVGTSLVLNSLTLERVLMALILIGSISLYIVMATLPGPRRARSISISVLAIILNLLLMRAVFEIGDSGLFEQSGFFFRVLPFLVPIALGPILVAVLVGSGPAIMSAFIVSVLFGVMQDGSMALTLSAFLSGLVAALLSRNVRQRSRLVRSSIIAGVVAALCALAFGLIHGLGAALVAQQMLVCVMVGVLTGILVIGLLPILENLFNVTTEITLLELTDFNHPLLRRMQIEAPGSYHHSLMVANLSENAAAAIGASPLLCRVCSFFHDIGKLVKPEYFIENQRGGVNPHLVRNPSMSALVIKAHVKEGVDLARKYKLPRIITDVIRQHHGTTLIQYFFHEARRRQQQEGNLGPAPEGVPQIDLKSVDESTYRYDGPKPRFKESAIIFFADSVEAASRSLKKVTTTSVEELIDGIVQERIEDGQLDECPLTFQELKAIRASFVFTLLNMLHSRVEYPKDKGKDAGKAKSEPSPEAQSKESADPKSADEPKFLDVAPSKPSEPPSRENPADASPSKSSNQ